MASIITVNDRLYDKFAEHKTVEDDLKQAVAQARSGFRKQIVAAELAKNLDKVTSRRDAAVEQELQAGYKRQKKRAEKWIAGNKKRKEEEKRLKREMKNAKARQPPPPVVSNVAKVETIGKEIDALVKAYLSPYSGFPAVDDRRIEVGKGSAETCNGYRFSGVDYKQGFYNFEGARSLGGVWEYFADVAKAEDEIIDQIKKVYEAQDRVAEQAIEKCRLDTGKMERDYAQCFAAAENATDVVKAHQQCERSRETRKRLIGEALRQVAKLREQTRELMDVPDFAPLQKKMERWNQRVGATRRALEAAEKAQGKVFMKLPGAGLPQFDRTTPLARVLEQSQWLEADLAQECERGYGLCVKALSAMRVSSYSDENIEEEQKNLTNSGKEIDEMASNLNTVSSLIPAFESAVRTLQDATVDTQWFLNERLKFQSTLATMGGRLELAKDTLKIYRENLIVMQANFDSIGEAVSFVAEQNGKFERAQEILKSDFFVKLFEPGEYYPYGLCYFVGYGQNTLPPVLRAP